MKFKKNTVAIGLQSHGGETRIFELESANHARGMTLTQIILIKPVTPEEEREWCERYLPCLMRSPLPWESRITKLVQ